MTTYLSITKIDDACSLPSAGGRSVAALDVWLSQQPESWRQMQGANSINLELVGIDALGLWVRSLGDPGFWHLLPQHTVVGLKARGAG